MCKHSWAYECFDLLWSTVNLGWLIKLEMSILLLILPMSVILRFHHLLRLSPISLEVDGFILKTPFQVSSHL